MRIATWNIERFKHRKYANEMQSLCQRQKADILILTETDRRFHQDYPYEFHTPCLSDAPLDYPLPAMYRNSENRVSIYTNYPVLEKYDTYNQFTAICVKVKTEFGELIVYGTIIGITGNRSPSFKDELSYLKKDIEHLSKIGNICICGDFNCSFADNYYFTNYAREFYLELFSQLKIEVLTSHTLECIDHIAVSDNFIKDIKKHIYEWNIEKKLSDHKGIVVELLEGENNV